MCLGSQTSTMEKGTTVWAGMERVLRYGLIAVLATLFLSSWSVHAETETTTRVTVRCPQPDLVAGQPLRVFAWNPVCRDFLPVETKVNFAASGEAIVSLMAGMYSFEVMAMRDDDTIVVVQSNSISVPRTTSATILVGPPRQLVLTHKGQELPLSQVGVRSGVSVGEVRWHHKASADAPRIVLTPGKSVCINALGSADTLHVAVWEKLTASSDDAPIRVQPPSSCYNCRFVLRDGFPAMRRVTAMLVFPDSRMEFPATETSRFVTNRRFLLVGYRAELDDGKCLEFEPLPWNVSREQRFEFGGPRLAPFAWAAYVWEEDGDKWWPHLVWRVDLFDPGGYRLNLREKDCGVISTARRTDGMPIPSGRVDGDERKRIGELGQSLRIKVDWTWNGNQSCELSPATFVPLRSEHFRIASVPAWQRQSWNYLSKLERYYRVLRAVTGRPGPASFKLDWRNNTHNAKAIVGGASGGGKDIWCSLPFRGYEQNDDPFSEPWFLGHELLHTFGYHHGDEMSHLQKLAEFQFRRYRWYVVDNPRTAVELPTSR